MTSELPWPADAWKGPVLACRMSSLGDVLIALDAVSRLKRRRPDLEVDFLTRPLFRPLAERCAAVHRVVSEAGSHRRYGVYWDLHGGPRGRRYGKSVACDLHVASSSQSLRRRGIVVLGRRFLRVPHQLHRFLEAAAGAEAVRDGLRRPGEALLDVEPAVGPAKGGVRRAGLAPQARHAMKEWPLERFAALSTALRQDGWKATWLLDPSRPVPDALGGRGESVVRGSLEDAARALAACDVVVAGDSGLAHLASALGRPVVVIFGSTVPELGHTPTGPHRIAQVDLPCRPCHVHGASRCWLGHRRCLREIGVGEVLGAIRELV